MGCADQGNRDKISGLLRGRGRNPDTEDRVSFFLACSDPKTIDAVGKRWALCVNKITVAGEEDQRIADTSVAHRQTLRSNSQLISLV